MIGDRIDVDMVFGKNSGMKTLFVESGMSTMKDVEEVIKEIEEATDAEKVAELKKQIPDFYVAGLSELYQMLK